jgi:phosphatidylethanolamine/phosphatidyl-N-methylethanolamine N-methyltransferase
MEDRSMDNKSNVLKYRLLAPVYDLIMNNNMFVKARKQALDLHEYKPNDKVLIVGVGTGEDLRFLPKNIDLIGIDLSKEMLLRADSKKQNEQWVLKQMNAEQLQFNNETFDVVVLNLILSVVGNPKEAMSEAIRVLKPNGTVIVFDKFLYDNDEPSLFRKVLNKFTNFIGTDINRNFFDMLDGHQFEIYQHTSSLFNGAYQIYQLKRELCLDETN